MVEEKRKEQDTLKVNISQIDRWIDRQRNRQMDRQIDRWKRTRYFKGKYQIKKNSTLEKKLSLYL